MFWCLFSFYRGLGTSPYGPGHPSPLQLGASLQGSWDQKKFDCLVGAQYQSLTYRAQVNVHSMPYVSSSIETVRTTSADDARTWSIVVC